MISSKILVNLVFSVAGCASWLYCCVGFCDYVLFWLGWMLERILLELQASQPANIQEKFVCAGLRCPAFRNLIILCCLQLCPNERREKGLKNNTYSQQK